MTAMTNTQPGITHLDMQAYVGITKHIGGRVAMDELLALCHIANASAVLNVGCGIGISYAYIAKKHSGRVVGVDISEKTIEWSRQRARVRNVSNLSGGSKNRITDRPQLFDHDSKKMRSGNPRDQRIALELCGVMCDRSIKRRFLQKYKWIGT